MLYPATVVDTRKKANRLKLSSGLSKQGVRRQWQDFTAMTTTGMFLGMDLFGEFKDFNCLHRHGV